MSALALVISAALPHDAPCSLHVALFDDDKKAGNGYLSAHCFPQVRGSFDWLLLTIRST